MKILALIALVLLTATTCSDNRKRQEPMTQQEIDDRLIEINRQMTIDETARIDAFVKDKDWPVTQSGTGLRYWLYTDSTGTNATKGNTALVAFEVTLLDGTVCYKTEEGEPRPFKVEQSDVESGLHEAIQYMSVGDRAKVILPSHLAHGLAGDMDKIPLKSTIVYDIELISLR